MTLTTEQAAELRKPFPKSQIGKIPASQGRPALDFVGHAAVTDRLNGHADGWTYTVDEVSTVNGACWIRGTMTIGGVSRVEFGDGKDPKEAIGNFIRRAAMRWGVAIDLWSREELDYQTSGGGATKPAERGASTEAKVPTATAPSPGTPVEAGVSRGTGSHDGSSPATATDQVPSRSPSPASTSSDPAGNASFGEGGTSPAASGHFDKEAAIAEAVRLCGGDLGKLMTHVRAKHPEWKTDPTYPVGKYNDLQGFHYLQIIEDFAEAALA